MRIYTTQKLRFTRPTNPSERPDPSKGAQPSKAKEYFETKVREIHDAPNWIQGDPLFQHAINAIVPDTLNDRVLTVYEDKTASFAIQAPPLGGTNAPLPLPEEGKIDPEKLPKRRGRKPKGDETPDENESAHEDDSNDPQAA